MNNLLLAIYNYNNIVKFHLTNQMTEKDFISISFNVSRDNIDYDFPFTDMEGEKVILSYKENNSTLYLCSESSEFIYSYLTFGKGKNCFFNVSCDLFLLNSKPFGYHYMYIMQNGIDNVLNDFLKSINGLTVSVIYI